MLDKRSVVWFVACVFGLWGSPCIAADPNSHQGIASGTHMHASGAAIASAHALATEAGMEMLARGGNAFDAAVAVSATLAVVEPISSGLGGGGFFLLHEARTGRDVFVDAREIAPAHVTVDDYRRSDGTLDQDRARNGAWAAAIPGLPAGLVHLADHYGRLPLTVTLAPAIRHAEHGFPVYERLVRGYAARRTVMERYPGTRAIFLIEGAPLREGQCLRQPDLAETLRRLATQGFDGFYRGVTARRLRTGVHAAGGVWQAEDLSGYRIVEREPLRFRYRRWQVVTAPPPSSGGVALAQMLQMLEPWDLQSLDSASRVHLTVEAMRRAFRDRSFYLGDPDFIAIPLRVLTSVDYASGLRASIHPDKATPSASLSGQPTPLEDDETTHFSIIDGEGNRVAATQTINLLFGSGLVPAGTGVLLNNEMDDFALIPGEANAYGVIGYEANAPVPGKRPLSSMTPTFLVSPERIAVLGTPGGSRIITMVLLGIVGFDEGLNAQQVTALPRYHHQWWPDRISAEPDAFDTVTLEHLHAMGHVVENTDTASGTVGSSHVWGNMQAVEWDRQNNRLSAGTDPRNPVGKAEVMVEPIVVQPAD